MKYTYTIKKGPMADRILNELRHLSAAEINDLNSKKALRLLPPNYELDYRALKITHLDDYSDATGSPVSYFLFGNTQVSSCYTEDDDLVLWYLRQLSNTSAKQHLEFFQNIFGCPLLDFSGRPANKLHKVVVKSRRIAGQPVFPDPFVVPEYKNIVYDIEPELKRWKDGNHYSSSFTFDADFLPDVASFCGVSIHWLLDISHTVYCENPTAERIFDFYTLLAPHDQKMFVQIIEELCQMDRKGV